MTEPEFRSVIVPKAHCPARAARETAALGGALEVRGGELPGEPLDQSFEQGDILVVRGAPPPSRGAPPPNEDAFPQQGRHRPDVRSPRRCPVGAFPVRDPLASPILWIAAAFKSQESP